MVDYIDDLLGQLSEIESSDDEALKPQELADLLEGLSESDSCDGEPLKPQELADSLVKKTRPRTSTNPKTIQATNLRAQKKLVAQARKGGEKTDVLTAAAVTFKVGQKTFPMLASMVNNINIAQLKYIHYR